MSRPVSFRRSLLRSMLALVAGATVILAAATVWFTKYLAHEFTDTEVRQTLSRVEQRVKHLAGTAVHIGSIARDRIDAAEPLPDQLSGMVAGMVDTFELDRDLSYIGAGTESTGEYFMLQRTPGTGVTRNREYRLLPEGMREIRDYSFAGTRREPLQIRPSDGYDPRQRPFYQLAKEGRRPAWTDSYMFWQGNERGSVLGLSYAVPIFDAVSNVAAVVDVDFDLFDLSGFLAEMVQDSNGYTFVVEKQKQGDFQVVAHPYLRQPNGTNHVSRPADPVTPEIISLFKKNGLRDSGPAAIKVKGEQYFWAAHWLDDPLLPHWALVTVVPHSAVIRTTRQVYLLLAFAVVGLLGLSAVLASIEARRVTVPLRELEERFIQQGAKVEPGDVPVTGHKEFRRLGKAFNQLAKNIREHRGELLQANTDLHIEIEHRQQAEARLIENSRRQRQQQFALAQHAVKRDLPGPDREESFRMLTRLAAETLNVERVSIWLFQKDGQTLICRDLYLRSSAEKHPPSGELSARNYPAYFAALNENRTIAAHNARTDPRTREFAAEYLRSLEITSLLDAPVHSNGNPLGVLCCEHVGPQRTWNADEEAFAGSIADWVALILEASHRRQAEAELKRHRDQLKDLVQERTAELSRMNMVLATEVQERQRAENEVRAANERLQELDRLKSEFLAMMSHELRTPLNSIIGFTGILKQRLAGPLTDEQDKQLGMVQGSARHLLTLINDLLDLSRIESGRMDLHLTRFTIGAVVQEVVKTLEPLASAKRLPLRVEMGEVDLEIYSDRKKIFQLLLNLASNAVKFTDQGSVTITIELTGGSLKVAVRDTGIGIKPEHMGLLFEAFRQVDGSARRVYEGTGLGLYLCRKLAMLLGGNVEASSTFGKGSEFWFTVPVTPPR